MARTERLQEHPINRRRISQGKPPGGNQKEKEKEHKIEKQKQKDQPLTHQPSVGKKHQENMEKNREGK